MRTAPVPQALTLPRARWVLWLAVWLALVGALAPTVSHVLQWVHGGAAVNLIEICTSAGPRWMALPASAVAEPAASTPAGLVSDAAPTAWVSFDSADGGGSGAPGGMEHCPFCLLMAEKLAPPSANAPLFFAAPGHAVRPQPLLAACSPAQSFAAAQPRAPPAL